MCTQISMPIQLCVTIIYLGITNQYADIHIYMPTYTVQ